MQSIVKAKLQKCLECLVIREYSEGENTQVDIILQSLLKEK